MDCFADCVPNVATLLYLVFLQNYSVVICLRNNNEFLQINYEYSFYFLSANQISHIYATRHVPTNKKG